MPMLRHKFGAIRTERDGIKFQSQKEARFYDFLQLEQKAGRVLFFLMQTPFRLPGGVVYRVDFMVFYTDGTVGFIETKGFRTKDYIIKKKLVEALFPITIEER